MDNFNELEAVTPQFYVDIIDDYVDFDEIANKSNENDDDNDDDVVVERCETIVDGEKLLFVDFEAIDANEDKFISKDLPVRIKNCFFFRLFFHFYFLKKYIECF